MPYTPIRLHGDHFCRRAIDSKRRLALQASARATDTNIGYLEEKLDDLVRGQRTQRADRKVLREN
jgi:hypothetical protein